MEGARCEVHGTWYSVLQNSAVSSTVILSEPVPSGDEGKDRESELVSSTVILSGSKERG
ncbi:MAG: hypothetical protein IH944_08925 [Armatimonadetes bacterium]|nr:hypothetical protein [Armatimonadota bacterium]